MGSEFFFACGTFLYIFVHVFIKELCFVYNYNWSNTAVTLNKRTALIVIILQDDDELVDYLAVQLRNIHLSEEPPSPSHVVEIYEDDQDIDSEYENSDERQRLKHKTYDPRDYGEKIEEGSYQDFHQNEDTTKSTEAAKDAMMKQDGPCDAEKTPIKEALQLQDPAVVVEGFNSSAIPAAELAPVHYKNADVAPESRSHN
jgi:hypothetical protein